jgi:S-adenosylmethionine uptake transporter
MITYSVPQVTFLRTVFRFIPFLVYVSIKQINPLKTEKISANILRSLIATAGTYTFMYAFKYAPLVDVTVVGNATAIFILPLSVLVLKEKFYIQNAIAVLLGFAGVVLAFRPGEGIFQIGIMYAIVAAVIMALNSVIIKKLSFTENELTMIFYHHICMLLASVFIGFDSYIALSLKDAALLFLAGTVSALGQYYLTHAYKFSASSELASAAYVYLLPATLTDYYMYGKIPDAYIIGGLVLIAMGTCRAFTMQSKRR